MRVHLRLTVPQHRSYDLTQVQQTLQAMNNSQVSERLANWVVAAQIGEAFRFLFPAEWRRTRASTKFGPGDLSEREEALFKLLEQDLPMVETDAYERDVTDERPDGPPVQICSNELNHDYEYDSVSVVEVVLGYLATWNADELHQFLTTEAAFPYALPAHPKERRDDRRFKRACAYRQRTSGGAWRDLPLALDVMGLTTGSPFTDAFHEDTFGFDEWVKACGWSREGLLQMKRAWQHSQKYLDALARVVTWLEAAPDTWPQVFAVWQRCHLSPEDEQTQEQAEQAERRAWLSERGFAVHAAPALDGDNDDND